MDQLITGDPAAIGPYRLIARLGAGGMGLVYLGRSDLGRTVAVKVVQAEHAQHPEFRSRFAREVEAARRVGGHWTAAVLDADTGAVTPWVATQYIPGPDLHTVVKKDFGPLPEHSVRVLANRLALALQAVHAAGLVHRDLKPSNVLVTVDGPRVIDFGIARAMDTLLGTSLATSTGMLLGSPGFMSPEQVRGLELTGASDVFCLGAVLVYAATGRLLFGAGSSGLNAHLFRIAEEEADLSGVPGSLAALVAECLRKDPAERPTPQQIADRTANAAADEEWLPGPVLAQLGRHAAQLLDFAPAAPVVPLADAPLNPTTPVPPAAPAGPSAPVAAAVPPQATPPQLQPQLQSQPPVQDHYGHLPQPSPQPWAAPAAYPPVAAGQFGAAPGQYPGAWSGAEAPVVPEDAPPPHPRRWGGLLVVALAQLMVPANWTAFNMALPSVVRTLHLSTDDMSLMTTAYLLAFGALLFAGGHLADLVGRRTTLVIGLTGFALASVIGGLAPSALVLTGARLLQGGGAALVTTAALALVSTGFTEPRERGRAFAVYGAIVAAGSTLGILTGGWLVEQLSWRVSFLVAVPAAAVAVIGAFTLLPDRRGPSGVRPDPVGLLLGCLGLAALLGGLNEASSHGWTDLLTLVPAAIGVVLLVGLAWWLTESAGSSLLPHPFRDRRRVGSLLVLALASAGMFTLLTALSFGLQQVFGYSPLGTGAAFLPMVAAILVAAALGSTGPLRRVAPGIPVAGGLVLTAVGVALLATLQLRAGYVTGMLPGLVLAGLGIGLAWPPIFATATAGSPARFAGALGAAVTAAQQLGTVLGGAFFAAYLTGRTRDLNQHLNQVSPARDAISKLFLQYCTDTLWWAAGGMVLAAVVAGVLVPDRSGKAGS